MHKTLYQIILDLCERDKISIYKLCQDLNIPQSTIYTWKSRPGASASLEVALELSKKFKVPIETFCIPREKG